jgi:hypothetical protein
MAAGEVGLDRIPAVIKVVDSERAFVLNIVENIHREGLTPPERARDLHARRAARRSRATDGVATYRDAGHEEPFDDRAMDRHPRAATPPAGVEEGRVKIGHAMRLTRVPEGELSHLLDEAEELSQPELEQRVAQIRNDPVLHSRRVASVDERQVMAALRSLSLVGAVDDAGPVRAGLQLVRSRVDELLNFDGELKGKSTGRLEIGKTDYQARGVLYLPVLARFHQILLLKESDNLGNAINDAMAAIEDENPQLKGVLPRTYQELGNSTLVSLLRSVNAILGNIEGDAFGKVYEYFLGQVCHRRGCQRRRVLHTDIACGTPYPAQAFSASPGHP